MKVEQMRRLVLSCFVLSYRISCYAVFCRVVLTVSTALRLLEVCRIDIDRREDNMWFDAPAGIRTRRF